MSIQNPTPADRAVAEQVAFNRRVRQDQHTPARPSFRPPSTARRGYFPDGSGVPMADDALGSAGDFMSRSNEALSTVKDLAKAGETIRRESTATLNKLKKARETVDQRIAHFVSQQHDATTARTEFDAEIRNHVKNSPKPADTARKMLRDGDFSVMAILRAPPSISGLTAEQHDLLKREAHLQFAPEATTARTVHEKARAALDLTISELQAQTKKVLDSIHDSDDARLSRLFAKREDAE